MTEETKASVKKRIVIISNEIRVAKAGHNEFTRSGYFQPDDFEVATLNLKTIKSPSFLLQLIAYRSDSGNYDRISAFGMLMILREDAYKIISDAMNVKQKHIAQDPFWFKTQNNSYNIKKIMSFPK